MKKFLMAVLIAAITLSFGTQAQATKLVDELKKKGVLTEDYFPEVKLRGRFHMDAGFYDEDVTEFGDGFNNRRTRMGIQGKLTPTWSFSMEYDFAENTTTANDVVLMNKLAGGTLKIGQFKVPMGLNELTSSNSITFIERASDSNAIVDARRIGVGYDYHIQQLGFQSMIFGRNMGGKQDGDMPMGVAARVYGNPIADDSMLIHIGGSVAFEDRQDYNTLRFRDRPEARADSGIRLIDTGNIGNVDDTLKAGAELALRFGPFSIEGEYLMVDVGREEGDEPTFNGYHVQAGYVVTGESRDYREGVFRGVSPKNNPWGAVEVAARYSSIDLNDEGFDGSGQQDNITLGVNYYASSNIRFMANYIMVDVTERNPAVIAGGEDSPNIFLLRAQYNF
jgi:phosphate-selective porin OprO and OprP